MPELVAHDLNLSLRNLFQCWDTVVYPLITGISLVAPSVPVVEVEPQYHEIEHSSTSYYHVTEVFCLGGAKE